VKLRLKRDVPVFADDTVKEKTVTNVVNTGISLEWFCDGRSGTYFTEVETNAGGKVNSDHLHFTC